MARHSRRRGRSKIREGSAAEAEVRSAAGEVDEPPAADGGEGPALDAPAIDEQGAEPDWLGSPEAGEDVVEGYAPQHDVTLAVMLMWGEHYWQRIDGMGLARQALETPATGDPRRDLSNEERLLLANGRAWCLAVHADLGHQRRRDDPIMVADALRHVQEALDVAPEDPPTLVTLALVQFRQGLAQEALVTSRRALAAFEYLPDRVRTSRTQGAAVLAVSVTALLSAATGDHRTAQALLEAARALRSPIDVDQVAFDALVAEILEWMEQPA